jgi:hypothetical protein
VAVIALGLLLPGSGGSHDTIKTNDAPVLGGAGNQSASSRATARSGGLAVTLTATPMLAKTHSPVEFNATAYERRTPGALGYELRYGDGTSAAQDMVPLFCLMRRNAPIRKTWRESHRYRKQGRYTVSLTVHVNCTSEHATATVTVDVTVRLNFALHALTARQRSAAMRARPGAGGGSHGRGLSSSARTAPVRDAGQTLLTAASRGVSYGDQPQLVKLPGAPRRHNVLALNDHDAVALEVSDGVAQRQWLHVAELGSKLGARPSLVVVVA